MTTSEGPSPILASECPFTAYGDGPDVPSVPDHLRAALAPASWILQEWTPYHLHVPDATHIRTGSLIQPADIPGSGRFRIVFENQLGLASIVPIRNNRPCGAPIHVEVIASKFPDAGHSIEFMKTTLADLFARGSTMPFVTDASTQRGIRDAFLAPNDLFAFHFFRHRGQDLVRGVQALFGRPIPAEHEWPRVQCREALLLALQGLDA